jgi:transcriptional regulator with XRE-family HTH domain
VIEMKLRDLIKQKRIEKGFSQAKLAKALGYSSGQFVSNWERGESYPPMDRLAKMSLMFDMDKNIFLKIFLQENSDSKTKEYNKAYAFHEYNLAQSKK